MSMDLHQWLLASSLMYLDCVSFSRSNNSSPLYQPIPNSLLLTVSVMTYDHMMALDFVLRPTSTIHCRHTFSTTEMLWQCVILYTLSDKRQAMIFKTGQSSLPHIPLLPIHFMIVGEVLTEGRAVRYSGPTLRAGSWPELLLTNLKCPIMSAIFIWQSVRYTTHMYFCLIMSIYFIGIVYIICVYIYLCMCGHKSDHHMHACIYHKANSHIWQSQMRSFTN